MEHILVEENKCKKHEIDPMETTLISQNNLYQSLKPVLTILVYSCSELYKNYTGGVFYDTTNNTEIDHDISVVGYGVDKETGWKYWLIRNSWGTYWVSLTIETET